MARALVKDQRPPTSDPCPWNGPLWFTATIMLRRPELIKESTPKKASCPAYRRKHQKNAASTIIALPKVCPANVLLMFA